jgi:hypothetical protein
VRLRLACISSERFEKDDFFAYFSTDTFPYSVKVVYALILKITFIVTALWVTWVHYETSQAESYLTFGDRAGDPLCNHHLTPVSGVWKLDSNGIWSGRSLFDSTTAFIAVELSDLLMHHDAFRVFMQSDVAKEIDDIAAKAKIRNLAANLATLTSFTNHYHLKNEFGSHSLQSISMAAEPSYIVDRLYKDAVLSNVLYDCDIYSEVFFDRTTSIVDVRVNYKSYNASKACETVVNPKYFGYINPRRNGEYFHIKYNIASLFVAFAVNQNLVNLSDLSPINLSSNPTFTLRK